MHRVLLDKWTYRQIFFPGGEPITDEAKRAADEALARNELFVSAVTYLFYREGLRRERRPDLDVAMARVRVLPLDQTIVVSLTKIPDGPPTSERLVAATALCNNLQLLTAFPELGCDGLEVINSKPPAMTARVAKL